MYLYWKRFLKKRLIYSVPLHKNIYYLKYCIPQIRNILCIFAIKCSSTLIFTQISTSTVATDCVRHVSHVTLLCIHTHHLIIYSISSDTNIYLSKRKHGAFPFADAVLLAPSVSIDLLCTLSPSLLQSYTVPSASSSCVVVIIVVVDIFVLISAVFSSFLSSVWWWMLYCTPRVVAQDATRYQWRHNICVPLYSYIIFYREYGNFKIVNTLNGGSVMRLFAAWMDNASILSLIRACPIFGCRVLRLIYMKIDNKTKYIQSANRWFVRGWTLLFERRITRTCALDCGLFSAFRYYTLSF